MTAICYRSTVWHIEIQVYMLQINNILNLKLTWIHQFALYTFYPQLQSIEFWFLLYSVSLPTLYIRERAVSVLRCILTNTSHWTKRLVKTRFYINMNTTALLRNIQWKREIKTKNQAYTFEKSSIIIIIVERFCLSYFYINAYTQTIHCSRSGFTKWSVLKKLI